MPQHLSRPITQLKTSRWSAFDALKSIEWLAQCRHVTVITDNTAVLHILDWNPRNRRQRRMLTYIMQFNLTICYICGSSNMIPDSLSRLFQDSSPQEQRENESKYMHEVDDFILSVTMRVIILFCQLRCVFKTARASLEPDRQTTDTTRTERESPPLPWPQLSSSCEATLHTTVRDDTKFLHAVYLAMGSGKTPPRNCPNGLAVRRTSVVRTS